MSIESKPTGVPSVEAPEWAKEIKRKYISGSISQFIIHSNINDLIRVGKDGKSQYLRLKDFLNTVMFSERSMVVYYDRAAGIRFKDDRLFGGEGKMRQDFVSTLKMFDELTGNSFSELSRDPVQAFSSLDTYFNLCTNREYIHFLIQHLERTLKPSDSLKTPSPKEEEMDIIQRFMHKNIPDLLSYIDGTGKEKKSSPESTQKLIQILKDRLDKPKSISFIIEYAENLIPMGTGASYRPEERMLLVFLQKWAKEPNFLLSNMTICLLTENLSEINEQYIKNPYTHEVDIPYPSEEDRLYFIRDFMNSYPAGANLFEMSAEVLSKNTAGLGLINLQIMLSEVVQNKIPFTNKELMEKKKEMIEAEAGGLLEFIKTKFDLSHVAGQVKVKKHLMDAARALKSGKSDVMPMGYLVSGPVGTGKTFMINCFANDIGVPMVMLKNFRSQWQGQTEGNLEKVLKILKAMSPVAVMVDEADAYLGNRNAQGDSGVSSRVFSMIATFMSNTENRGRIIWFLVTARPDLMPVDFKRQGRAEEHIALFYPETIAEKQEMMSVMLKKTDLGYIDIQEFDQEFFEDISVRSGADMESALTRAKFRAAALGLDKVTFDIIAQVFADFLPPTYPEEIELMNYSAVLECTSKELLPDRFKEMSRQEVLDKVEELKSRIR